MGISSVTASTAVYVQRFCNLGLERSSWRLEGVSRVSGFGVVLIMDVEASLLPGQCVDSELRLLALWCVEASASRSQSVVRTWLGAFGPASCLRTPFLRSRCMCPSWARFAGVRIRSGITGGFI
jgi:hypothetical protein